MNFKIWSKIRESVKDDKLDEILDKINSGQKISKREQDFLDSFDKNPDIYYQDYKFLSNTDTCQKISDIIETGKIVHYDIYDENSLCDIKSISNYERCLIELNNGKEVRLKDSYLYNLLYDFKKDSYSLKIQDEFFEKIPITND